MSKLSKRQTATEKTRRLERAGAKTKSESPCGRRPAQIDAGDITVEAITTDATRHGSYRLRVTWPEVTEDIDGFPVSTIDRYIVHLQHSEDGTTWDSDYRRKVVEAKDGDSNTIAKAIFKGVRRKRYYRVRVRARDEAGCRSVVSDWTSSIRPGSSATVTGVGTITRTRVGPRRIEFDWEDSTDPDFDRYKVQILKADTETGTYSVVRTRYVRHSYIGVHVPSTDKTKWWKVRVRVQTTLNPDGTRDESSDDDSTADQADDLSDGKLVVSFSTGGINRAKLYQSAWTADRPYRITRVRMRVGAHDADTHPSDGCPAGGPIYANIRIYSADETSFVKVFTLDSRLTVEEDTHKDSAAATDMANTDIDEDETLAVRLTRDETNTFMGRGLTLSIVLEPR